MSAARRSANGTGAAHTARPGTEAAVADERWTVDFWLDPSCPLTRTTARWITSLAGDVPLDVRWHVMSLFLLNEHREVDPEGDEEGYLRIPARVATAVRAEHGSAALGAFHEALWTDPDGTQREWAGDLGEALRRCGLPDDLASAGWEDGYDAAMRASHEDGVGRVDAEIGTPVLAVTAPDGELPAFFGPVLSELPEPADALRLWRAALLLAGVPGFREIKR
ncbi:disulfide bond formation protein DsbA [Nocardiopsis tropica]|uniref:Disulfide bond formation protein DsbA n=1 Tax=Nocardiopsis tropica TaxID=109330 RepID=A0ABV1ZM80_9ACTN